VRQWDCGLQQYTITCSVCKEEIIEDEVMWFDNDICEGCYKKLMSNISIETYLTKYIENLTINQKDTLLRQTIKALIDCSEIGYEYDEQHIFRIYWEHFKEDLV
jgi:hypothetical protein